MCDVLVSSAGMSLGQVTWFIRLKTAFYSVTGLLVN